VIVTDFLLGVIVGELLVIAGFVGKIAGRMR
jgi:hypothetical protein